MSHGKEVVLNPEWVGLPSRKALRHFVVHSIHSRFRRTNHPFT